MKVDARARQLEGRVANPTPAAPPQKYIQPSGIKVSAFAAFLSVVI